MAKSDERVQGDDKAARLAKALRDNLRRRKAASVPAKPPSPTPEES